MAGVALYAGLFEPAVAAFDLSSLPASHHDGVVLMNVLRVLDLPQAAALLFPRPVVLRDVSESDFTWTQRVAELFSAEKNESPLVFGRPER